METILFLDEPEVWVEFDADGDLIRIFGTASVPYRIEFQVKDREFGPYDLPAGAFDYAIPKGWGRRWADLGWVQVERI